MLKDIRVRVVPRLFHFKQPAGTSRGVYTQRRVWYVVITSTDASRPLSGIGECAPLPDLSCDYVPEYEAVLREFCARLEREGTFDAESLRPYPSMLFGVETAVLSAKASLRGDYTCLYDTPFTRGEQSITINGLVWMGSHDEMLRRMEEKLEGGFGCVKLKIGAIDFDHELDLIRKLRQRFTAEDVILRVDANGAFSAEEARDRLQRLSEFDIHSIEQPIRAGQWEEMSRLCRVTPLPIALDEELIGINEPQEKRRMLETVRPQYIILKPSLHGGLSGAEEWMREADRLGIRYWVTSALESNVGLNALAQWASTFMQDGTETHLAADTPDLRGNGPHMDAGMPQGLGTGQLFVDNFQGCRLSLEGEKMWMGRKDEREFRAALRRFEEEWRSPSSTMTVKTSGSTGKPKQMEVSKRKMKASAERTCRFLGLEAGHTALLCMPLEYIAGKMMAVRSLVRGFRLYAVPPSSHPFARLNFAPDFVAMTPMQVFETLQVPRERCLLRKVKHLIIGGGAVSDKLKRALRDFPNHVWSTYGMTETLSHIAMCRLNGADAKDCYTPLLGVAVSLSDDGRLIINVPDTCDEVLLTNDYADILPDGSFRILGRADNVVCSGGLKFQLESIESKLSDMDFAFQLTAVADEKYGQAMVLLYEGEVSAAYVAERCRSVLSRYELPKHFLKVQSLPLTETGKPARREARKMAEELLLK